MVGMLVIDDNDGPFLPIVYRLEWTALPPVTIKPLRHPVPYVRVTQTYTPECHDNHECMMTVQDLQEDAMENRYLNDIDYNFLISKCGIVYEGRGWFAEPDREIQYQALTDKCVDIAYIGDYTNEDPPWVMVQCLMDMIQYGIKHKYIKNSFKLINLRTNPRNIK